MAIRKYGLITLVLLISLLLQDCSVAHAREAKDKSKLYERYPQLLSADTDPCVRGLNQVFINMNTNLT